MFFIINLHAQETLEKGQIVTITLSNQEKITGKVISEDDAYLYLMVKSEKLSIPKKNILYHSIASDEDIKEGEYKDYADQYFLTPSAIPVSKGEIYYRNIDLFGHLFSFGVTERFSINAGFESLSLFAGETPVFIFTPKYSIPLNEKLRIGLGASSFIHEDDFGAFLFGNGTIGNSKNNLTLGLGLATDGDEVVDQPLFFLGYAVSISERFGFYGDYISIPIFDDDDYEGILTFNMRIKFRGGIAFDIGAGTNSGFDGAIPSLAVILPIK
jgi:hypothetical protein